MKSIKKDWPFFAVVVPLFLFLSLFKLAYNLPTHDEAEIATWGMLRFFGINFFSSELFFLPGVKIAGMTRFYAGTLSMYLSVPVLCELSLVSIRLGYIIAAGIGLWAFYYCMRVWLGAMPALFAVFSMSLNSMVLFCVRRGAEHEELLVVNLFLAGLALLVVFFRHNGKWLLFAAGFLWGLALFTNIVVLVYVLGLLCVCVCFRQLRNLLRFGFSSWAAGGLIFLGFVFGGFPVFNAFLTDSGVRPLQNGMFMYVLDQISFVFNRAEFLEILYQRGSQLAGLASQVSYISFCRHNIIWSSWLSLVVCAVFCVRRGKKGIRYYVLYAWLLVFAAVFTALVFMHKVSSFDPSHIMVLFPLFHMLDGFALWVVLTAQSKTVKTVLLVCFTAVFACDLYFKYEPFAACYDSVESEFCVQSELDNNSGIIEFIRDNELFPLFFWHDYDSTMMQVRHRLSLGIFLGKVPLERIESICRVYKKTLLGTDSWDMSCYYAVLQEEESDFEAFCADNSLRCEKISDYFDSDSNVRLIFYRIEGSRRAWTVLRNRWDMQKVFFA